MADQEQEPVATTTSEKEISKQGFDVDLIKRYPRSNKRLSLNVAPFGIADDYLAEREKNGQSVHISPHGIEFKTSEELNEGELVKIHIVLPDYWNRKQKLVNYGRVDNPGEFKVLGKVVRTEDVSKRGKKKLITVQTLIMDDVDEQVLKKYLQDG
jgi:hypothetical protein